MPQAEHLQAFVNLGELFTRFYENPNDTFNGWRPQLDIVIEQAEVHNPWYTKENIAFCLLHWGQLLTEQNLNKWYTSYRYSNNEHKIAIVMAGNIPLVGFHDYLAVLLSGHSVLAKLSSNDRVLLPFVVKFLNEQDPSLSQKIELTEGRLQDFDAVIATGSNNTARYFEYYFKKYPSIIRKNRNSIAVLDGNETPENLTHLAQDIFRYFGLGCRSVSKLYVPKGYRFDTFFESIFEWKDLLDHHKYVNNYDYNKAVYLMSEVNILDNGFLIVKEDKGKASPIGTLFYEEYDSLKELSNQLSEEAEELQCIVSNCGLPREIGFGTSQIPALSDYADSVDTMKFLVGL